VALVNQSAQRVPHAAKVDQLLLDLGKAPLSERPDGRSSAAAVVELQQLNDLVERESQRLGAPDEAQPCGIRCIVEAIARSRTRRLLQQACAFVEAHRVDADVGGARKFSDGERAHGQFHSHYRALV